MSHLVSRFLQDESGASAIEYGMIAAFVATIIVGTIGLIGSSLSTTFTKVAGLFS